MIINYSYKNELEYVLYRYVLYIYACPKYGKIRKDVELRNNFKVLAGTYRCTVGHIITAPL